MTDQERDRDPAEQMEEEQLSPQQQEKQEEAKLKAKYAVPGALGGPPGRLAGGHSAFLQKRLAKGQKFFDSGDYQMAKQKKAGINKPTTKQASTPFTATGDAIPTPETVPLRKTSLVQPSKLTSNCS